ncbi:hypothetical protein DPMN_079683 [Dreissena polymorpha]|uniref:Uncharacterized protein n=1 Tax=Dreissena polymorpha TaxID=45954 RepID=A0A9D3YPG8_DREPO|nr:hypothetical protein DPMN_079683 [Dreissena polymorpha]
MTVCSWSSWNGWPITSANGSCSSRRRGTDANEDVLTSTAAPVTFHLPPPVVASVASFVARLGASWTCPGRLCR